MPETSPPTPLDLSAFDNLDPLPVPSRAITTLQTTEPHLLVTTDERLQAQPRFERLVEVANLSPEDLAAAQGSAAKIDFRNTNNLMAHGDGVLAGIAQASRQLLAGVRVGEAGEVGRIAAAVIDGVKILRIQDLQTESSGSKPVPARA
jgi:hypothetical protein